MVYEMAQYNIYLERGRETERDRDRDRERQRERDRERGRETERERDRERDRERERQRETERERQRQREGEVYNLMSYNKPIFDNDISELLTARDNSIGSSGGTTDVNINVHSKNNLYLFLSGFSVPKTTLGLH